MSNYHDSNMLNDDTIDEERTTQAKLILGLRSEGFTDPDLLKVMEKIPRSRFIDSTQHSHDFYFSALPIECGQTISAPNVVAKMTHELELNNTSKVFEVGTGSGYQTAILASLAGHVYTTERFKTLIDLASERLRSLNLSNVTLKHADGMQGLSNFAPFDRIIITAANPEIPQNLVDQLSPNGIMVLPVGNPGDIQKLTKLVKVGEKYEEIFLCDVRFVPIREGIAKKL